MIDGMVGFGGDTFRHLEYILGIQDPAYRADSRRMADGKRREFKLSSKVFVADDVQGAGLLWKILTER